ncbi:MAG: PKD domain-containing protein [Myxococcales bacterium]|nr:PKD domain-containing protein [Myxococcales bacterium]
MRAEMGGDREVEAGVEVPFGAEAGPALSWDFGDGAGRSSGKRVLHAFGRAGRYTVRAYLGEEEVGRAVVKAGPRPPGRAIPSQAEAALWLPRIAGNLEPAVDFLERVAGAELAQATLERWHLPALAMELAATDAAAIDTEEGLGLFRLPGFDGTVILLGVADGSRALEALVKRLEGQGAAGRQELDRSILMRTANGAELALFLDRGYLYVAVPDEGGEGEDDSLGEVMRAVRQSAAEGLSRVGAIAKAGPKVSPQTAYLYIAGPSDDQSATRRLAGALLSARVGERSLELDGVVVSDASLWSGAASRAPALLRSAPEGATVAMALSVPAADLYELLAGSPGSQRRKRNAMQLSQAGLDLEELLSALSGEVSALGYFDAEGFLENLAAGSRTPEPRGGVLLAAGLARQDVAERLLPLILDRSGVRYDLLRERGFTRLRTKLRGYQLELVISGGRLRLEAGTGVAGRAAVDLGKELGAKLGGGAFSAGHASAFLDLGQLRRELEQPRLIPGVDPERLVMVQGFSAAFIDHLTPIDHLYLDVAPYAAGARVRGRIELRPK